MIWTFVLSLLYFWINGRCLIYLKSSCFRNMTFGIAANFARMAIICAFMPFTPEDRARQNIDKLLADAGWLVQDKRQTNLSVGRGVAVREFPLKAGHGEADYLLFVD